MSRGVLLLLAVLAVLARADAPVESRRKSRTILHAALVAACYGGRVERRGIVSDVRAEWGAIGLGRQTGRGGFLVAVRLAEGDPDSDEDTTSFEGGLLPVYLHYTYGVSGRWLNPAPALHAFISARPWRAFGNTTWVRAGVGAKWRLVALSPEVELSYCYMRGDPGVRSALSAHLKFEVGGWWLLGS